MKKFFVYVLPVLALFFGSISLSSCGGDDDSDVAGYDEGDKLVTRGKGVYQLEVFISGDVGKVGTPSITIATIPEEETAIPTLYKIGSGEKFTVLDLLEEKALKYIGFYTKPNVENLLFAYSVMSMKEDISLSIRCILKFNGKLVLDQTKDVYLPKGEGDTFIFESGKGFMVVK